MIVKRIKRTVADGIARVVSGAIPSAVMRDKRYFGLWQERGYHVTPLSFYEPIPDTRELPDTIWDRPSEMVGINMRDDEQVALLADYAARFKAEYDALPTDAPAEKWRFFYGNPSFRSGDAELLWCILRDHQPKRMIEIGSGYSTMLACEALRKNAAEGGPTCEFTAIEPYPRPMLRQELKGLSQLVEKRVQDVSLATFEALADGDILFIDSSHVLRIGSDVEYEFMEILPRLQNGVIVHVHDIFLPANYPRKWVKQHQRFWTEQYLLQAFLQFNDSFEVLFGGSWMHLKHPDALAAALKSYNAQTEWPGSFWMRRVR